MVIADVRRNAFLFCGAAVLLSACGGGGPGTVDHAESLAAVHSAASQVAPSALVQADMPTPIATVSPARVDFGSVTVGTNSAIMLVTILNTGTAALSFPVDFTVGAGPYAFGGAGDCKTNRPYAPGERCTASLVFTPGTTGTHAGSLTITSNASDSPQVIALTGIGASTAPPAPIATFSPAILDFGPVTVGTNSAVSLVTIKNTGTAPLSFPVDFTVADSQYTFGGAGNCAVNHGYAPGESCTASIVFAPGATGTQSGRLTITSNASTSPQVIALTGSGTAASTGLHLYVAPGGNDSRSGNSPREALRTINHAANVATAGYTVHVASGNYEEDVITSSSGTADAYITYISDVRGGAKVISSATDNSAAWHNLGDYVAIIGFDITGAGALGINHSGSYDIAKNNHVHDIPAKKCDGYGGAGIGFDQYLKKQGGIADSNIIHDIGPLATNCFRVQGVYTSIPGVTISNNIIYRVVGYAVTNGHCSYDVRVLNNTMFNNGGFFPNGGYGEGGGVVMTGNDNCPDTASNGNVVANNIIFNNVIGIHEERVDLKRGDYTIYRDNLVSGSVREDWGRMYNTPGKNYSGTPKFVNYLQDGGGDYHLGAGSAAIGMGSSYSVPNDFDGKVRPSSVPVDLGAYKY